MNAPETAKAFVGNAGASEIRHLDSLGSANHHIFNLPFSIYENTDLPSGFKRNFRQLPRQFRRDNLFRGNAASGKFFYPPQLIML
jgi:hypothetical protein